MIILCGLVALLSTVFIVYRFFYQQISTETKVEKWVGVLYLTVPLYFLNSIVFNGYSAYLCQEFNMELIIGITLIMWYGAAVWKNKPPSHIFKSDTPKDPYDRFMQRRIFKNIHDFKNNQISNYPRLTIHDVDINANSSTNISSIIFDSSDYEVITQTIFPSGDSSVSFENGARFRFKDETWTITHTQTDFISIFDDYSIFQSPVYLGINMPYNIQVIVKATRRTHN